MQEYTPNPPTHTRTQTLVNTVLEVKQPILNTVGPERPFSVWAGVMGSVLTGHNSVLQLTS